MGKKELKIKIREYDTEMWREGMQNKTSLRWYRQGKENIGYERCYSNNINSTYLAKARTNSLQLEDHLGRGVAGYDETCKLCKLEEEDLEHFLIKYPELEKKRNKEIMKNEQRMTAEERTIQIMFKEKHYGETGKMIRSMWDTENIE